MMKLLGSGAEGSVYHVTRGGQDWALKINIQPLKPLEREIMETYKHPNLIAYHSTKPEILMELGVPLLSYITNYPYSLKHVCLEVLSGLEYLHAKGVDHNDLHIHNLVVVKGVVKICDFGRVRKRCIYSTVKRDIEYFGYLLYNILFHQGRDGGSAGARVQHMRFSQNQPWERMMVEMGKGEFVELYRGCCNVDHRKLLSAGELVKVVGRM